MNADFMRGVRWERDQILLMLNSMDITKLDENDNIVLMTPDEVRKAIYKAVFRRG